MGEAREAALPIRHGGGKLRRSLGETRGEAEQQLKDDKLSAVLVIPPHFASNYLTGQNVRLELIKNPAEQIHPAVLEELLEVVVGGLNAISRNFNAEFPAWRKALEGDPNYHDIARLIEIMAALRTPQTGCPWDLEQTFASIAPYTLEEAYEVADAIARNDLPDLQDELGDLLLQVVFHARMAQEQGAFDFGDVVEAITRKMIRRHPHVFADKDGRLTPSDVRGAWDRIKAEEKAERAARRPSGETVRKSLLSGVKAGQPALTRAMELQRKASSVGFDWNDPRAVLHKIREEADEIEAALDRGDADELAGETGDLLFALVNLARHVGADPDLALRGTNAKFERRFGYIEQELSARGRSLESASLTEMDALWNEAKREETTASAASIRTEPNSR